MQGQEQTAGVYYANQNAKDAKKISSNKEANDLAKELGYKDANEFKKEYVGKDMSKYDIYKNSKTGEIFIMDKSQKNIIKIY